MVDMAGMGRASRGQHTSRTAPTRRRLKSNGRESLRAVELSWLCRKLLKEVGGSIARQWDIDITSAKSEETFKWLVAAILYTSMADEHVARASYTNLRRAEALSVEELLKCGETGLAELLRHTEPSTRDQQMARDLVGIATTLKTKYEGDLNRLHFLSSDGRDLAERLCDLGNVVTSETLEVFLGELRGVWEKVDKPLPSSAALAASRLGLTAITDGQLVERELEEAWERRNPEGLRFADWECALTRLGLQYCQNQRCYDCPAAVDCLFPIAK
jgi:endonuclease III